MNADRTVTNWLQAQAPSRAPERLLGETMERIATVPQERVLWRRPQPVAHRAKARPLFALIATILAISLLGGLGVVGGLTLLPGPSESPRATTPPASPSPESTASPRPTERIVTVSPPGGGRIVFSTNGLDPAMEGDIYLVADGQPARKIVGSDVDALNERCPALSPDGTQLAYGQARGTDQAGHSHATLVVADLDDLGDVVSMRGFGVSDIGSGSSSVAAPPCAIWSPDGGSLAFGVAVTQETPEGGLATHTNEVRVIRIDGSSLTSIPVSATDLDWSPNGVQLAIASSAGISIDTIAAGDPSETLPGTEGATRLSWSPDGRFLAYQRGEQDQLVVHDIATAENHVLATGYSINHGIGPVWSPAGEQIVYQRVCDTIVLEDGRITPCREDHDVVLVEAGPGSDWRPSEVTERLMPRPVTDFTEQRGQTPMSVTWSPDGSNLLYATIDGQLIAVPISGESSPLVLAQRDDLTVPEAGFSIPIQIWGVPPAVGIPPTAWPAALRPGTHIINKSTLTYMDRFPPVTGEIRFTVPAGWMTDGRGRIFKGSEDGPSGIGLQFGTIEDVYADPCRWSGGFAEIQPTRGVIGLPGDVAIAIAGDLTRAQQTTLSFRNAYHLTHTVPANIAGCDNGEWRRWTAPDGRPTFQHRAGQIDDIWIADTDRQSILIHIWYFADTAAEDRAEMQQILESIGLGM